MTNPFDLRDWIERAKEAGQLRVAEGANLQHEVGTITEINAKKGGPAILFDKFDGYQEGYRVLTGSMLNARTFGMTLGLDSALSNLDLVDKVAEILRNVEKKAESFPMEFVEDGPVMENRMVGQEVDLNVIPVPIWHELDGGAYIGTGTWQIHQDPDTGWVNVGTYRVQRLGKDIAGNYISPGHHGHIIRQKYWDRGEPCPVIMCFGAHPLFYLMGSSDVPAGVDELTWAGAIAGKRVPVIKGPVTGLPIPADCEIVIEGYAYPDQKMLEGPFGEFTGYYGGGEKQEHIVQVKALYFRNQPILLGAPPNRPPNDMSYQFTVMRSAAIKEALHKAGVPDVKSVWVAEAGGGRMWIVTSIKQRYAGHAAQAAAIACNCQAGALMAKYSIVVDDDIDPSKLDEVIWAICTRTNPIEDIDILRQCWSNPLETMIPTNEKNEGKLYISKAIINACRPFHRLNEFAAVSQSSAELMQRTLKKWDFLFK